MADQLARLESELERLARAVVYPDTPSMASAVRRRLEADVEATPRAWWPRLGGRPALALAAIAAAVVLALALGAWSPGREAVADFFDRLRIFQSEESPEGLPRDISGTPVSQSQAEIALGFVLKRPTYPQGLELERVLLEEFPGFRAGVLFYKAPDGSTFALFETEGVVAKELPSAGARGEVPEGTAAEPVSGLGREAYWLEGVRIVTYGNDQGDLIRISRRVTDANTLVWDDGEAIYRIEGDLSMAEAIAIALSLR